MTTFQELQSNLIDLHFTQDKTLREIAAMYDNKVSHATIARVIDGHEPTSDHVREVFDLPIIQKQYRDRNTGRFTKG